MFTMHCQMRNIKILCLTTSEIRTTFDLATPHRATLQQLPFQREIIPPIGAESLRTVVIVCTIHQYAVGIRHQTEKQQLVSTLTSLAAYCFLNRPVDADRPNSILVQGHLRGNAEDRNLIFPVVVLPNIFFKTLFALKII